MFPITDTIPTRTPPVATWTLILLNSMFFFGELQLSPEQLQWVFYHFGVVPARYTGLVTTPLVEPTEGMWSVLSLLTTMFLHGSWLHFLGNMWTLWIFGDNVEERMGSLRFLLFYLLCGIAASFFHILTNPTSVVPAIGASGAISGILGAYFFLYPFARIIVVVPIFIFPFFFELSAFFFLALWFYLQLIQGVTSLVLGAAQGIAWWAHIGGFVFGALFWPLFTPKRRPLQRDEHGAERAYMPWKPL